ncbi:MAG TPA: serine/threonine-protein kinase [Verrucomicrobiae bacterium]|nr:serine/threonine-protein kinase [Verrucomicrobiae bacterium]
MSKSIPTAAATPPSKRFGDYELLEEIARGGMGVVYRARQVSLNRVVAVKVLLFGQFASDQFVKRFRAEAEAAGNLRHPNIVAIHEIGEQSGQHYFSMDYVDGPSLAELARDKPLPAQKAACYLKIIAEAVEYAHGRGLLHRDLKPSNVLVDASGQPHVTDFGLAKRLSGDSELTLAGQVLGSPSFMPPEQAASDRGPVGPWSDVYSLGSIFYQLLTGRPPFVAESIEGTIAQVLRGQPAPPRLLNPAVPPDLETICLKCLETEPSRRYTTARELADELGRYNDGKPIKARPIGLAGKMGRWARRQPAQAALLGIVLLLLVTIAIGSTIEAIRLDRARGRASRAEQSATEKLRDSYLAQARAQRRSGQAGQRFDSLEAVRKAVAIRPSVELRNEAIAALALTDVRLTNTWPHVDSRLNICYSGSFDRYAIGREDGQISVRRAPDNAELARLPGVGMPIQWISGFNSDERLLAVNYYGDQNFVWDIAQRQPVIKSVPGVGCALTADGGSLLVGTPDSAIALYSLASGGLVQSWLVPEPIEALVVEPHGRAIGGFRHGSSVFYVLDLPEGQVRWQLTHPARIASTAWSADGNWLAVGCHDRRVHIWDLRTGERRAVLEGHENAVVAMGFNHAGTLLATTSWDDTFRLWNTSDWKQLLVTSGTSYMLKFDPKDHNIAHLLHGGMAGTLEIAKSADYREIHGAPNAHSEAWSVDTSPDGRLAVTGHTDGFVLWDLARGREIMSLAIGACRSVCFLPDGQAFITSGDNGLAFWPVTVTRRGDRDEVRVGQRHSIRDGLRFMHAALSGDGKWVAAANREAGSIAVYEIAHPENRFPLTNLVGVQFISASSDMRRLAAGTWGGTGVKIWNVTERRLERELAVPGAATVAFSPDGRLLATGTGLYEVWEAGSWRKLYEVHKPDPENAVGTMAFSPDNKLLAVVQSGRDIVLLRADTGVQIATLEAPRQPGISTLCFNRNGSKLVALESGQNLQIWDLREMRSELATLKLDWDEPPYPMASKPDPQDLPPLTGTLLPFSPEELAQKIPPHDFKTPSRCIDLSAWFNAPLGESWQGDANIDNDLRDLPRGIHEFAGVPFDSRGVVQLANPRWPGRFPTNISGIKINQRCRRLQFLHSTSWTAAEGAEVARFIIHFKGGRTAELPLRYGEHVRDWWEWPDEPELRATDSVVAWRGTNPLAVASKVMSVRLFKTTWDNPEPDASIETVDFVSGQATAPFLLAITAEP